MLKIVLIAIVFGIICLYLKNSNNELYSLCLLASSIIISYYGIIYLIESVNFFNQIFDYTGIDKEAYQIVLKIVGVGIVAEYGYNILSDMEMKTLANKVTLISKIFILIISFPIINSVLEIIKNILEI